MKIKNGYVSNSSTSSFIILNWSSLTSDKKNKILNYAREAFEEWKKCGIDTDKCNWEGTYHIKNDFESNAPDYLNFGFINPDSDVKEWHFNENEDGTLEVSTWMDNFNMYKWMNYLGCYKYQVINDDNDYEGFRNYKIYVCSQYRGDVKRNVERAKSYCRDIALEGNIPICPHLYFTQFLDDEAEEERTAGIEFGKNLLKQCDFMYVYTVNGVISDGMKEEIEFAKKENNILIRYFDREE